MLIVLSPAKTLDYDTPLTTDEHTLPDFIDDASELVDILKQRSPADLSALMGISDALAVLNVTRYAEWSRKFTKKNARPAILAFNGDVYEGLAARSLTSRQLGYAQSHLRILSGLYGVLRPLDLMQPYRLEMGTRLANGRGKDLYAFWGARVTETLNKELAAHKRKVLVNLASEEYFKVVKPKQLDAEVVTPVFEDWKGGKYKIISFHAKRARGLMARFAAAKGVTQPEKLKEFDAEGYAYDVRASTAQQWVFRRRTEG
ncbi:MAG TPA: peroxide stress protein YaaA [Noviherbaspirillum sp.]|uniref:peroxide stress protein YaaA n=1 Tax=Noviherbaspirillum sp. TaxID=1926288 RepID=UPI002D388F9F|nr:peroxide stress protein YaaA [Noviherbaspirillum sp.]HYD96222.1 peroxide stress protein YaaA [Noviherbaspirillum sp.]